MTNAKFCRNLICAGLGALALGYVPLSHAFYAQATPPLGFTAGAVNTFNAARAGVAASVELGRIGANAALSVGGRSFALATRMPLAAGAARVAALAIYAHPATRIGVGVAAWLLASKLSYEPSTQSWGVPDPDAVLSDGYSYTVARTDLNGAVVAVAGASFASACSQWGPKFAAAIGHTYVSVQHVDASTCRVNTKAPEGYNDYWHANPVSKTVSQCQAGWYVTPAGCTLTPQPKPVTQEEFVRELEKQPMPATVPREVPADLPIDIPWFEPIFIPTGAPIKNPAYDPTKPQTGENQPYVQPGVKVDPANDAKNPFQVNVQPSNRPTASPTGSTDAQPITPGSGTETDGSNDQPKEDKDERDLCEKNPDILACQKVDTEVEDAEIPKAQKTVSYMPENPFGGGACPADQYARVGGQQLKVVDWTRDCQFVRDYVTPVAFVLTTLIVGAILLGGLKP